MFYIMLSILIKPLEFRKNLRLSQSIDGIRCKYFAPEDFVTPGIFFCLSSFKHAIFVWPGKNHLTALTNVSTILICKPNFILI